MNKTKIEWCDATINPVIGCKNNCPYCYARRMNSRFHFVPDFSKPQFFQERLKAFESKTPKSIFINSMSDIYFWKPDWIRTAMRVMQNNPQHEYLILSKGANLLSKKSLDGNRCFTDTNVHWGITIDKQDLFHNVAWYCDFISIEPILEPINIKVPHIKNISQIIIGAETGNRKGKVIPKPEWIFDLCRQADALGLKVFMKDSLIPIIGEENMRRELIWTVHKNGNAGKTGTQNKADSVNGGGTVGNGGQLFEEEITKLSEEVWARR